LIANRYIMDSIRRVKFRWR